MSSTIQIRIDEKTKVAATKIFEKLGMDMSSGIKLFLHQVILRKGMPHELAIEHKDTKNRS